MNTRHIPDSLVTALLHFVSSDLLVFGEELPYRDVSRHERWRVILVRQCLIQLISDFLAGLAVYTTPLTVLPVAAFPSSICPMPWSATLAVRVLPGHEPTSCVVRGP